MNKICCLILLLLPFYGSAQDVQILNGGPWVLEKIEINEVEYFPEAYYVEHIFMENQSILSHWNCVEMFTSQIQYIGSSQFILSLVNSSESNCEVAVDIYQKHYEFYFGNGDQNIDPFSYQFLQGDQTQMLIITNSDGNKAYYGHLWLNTNFATLKNLTLYPNPIKDILQLYGNEMDNIVKAELFDLSGKKIAFQIKYDHRNTSINLADLSSGIYVIKITTKNGDVELRKIVKE